ncbi:hypothetical protein [Candidatus Berkiella aquae]|uniref:F-box domain-containing protein n=1 Tax=Candidatus Berkiella aquae TaxID=295108 RepID=A0A0Q9YYT3_9GAMM|nr:hypothetical protein [Candidatus Berkiella aquae]MCS5710915.1 hypothetical protein [Candidatus Berkiella aquae]
MQNGPNRYDQPPPNKRAKFHEEPEENLDPSPLTQFNNIPIERLLHIVNYLPAYQRFGLRRVSLISRQFQSMPSQISFAELYQSCLKDPEGVPYLLSHPTCLAHFTTTQLLELVSCNLTLATKILVLLSQAPFMRSTYFSIVGLNLDVAKMILLHYEDYGFETIDELTLFEILAQMHEEIALKLLTIHLPNLNFLAYQIVNIAFYHETAAELVLNTQALFDQLADDDIACLVCQHERLAIHVLNTPELNDRMGIFELSILGSKHLSVAKRILQEQGERFQEPDLIELCSHNPLIAAEIIHDPLIVEKLSEGCVVFMASLSEPLALSVVSHPTLSQRLSAQSLVNLAMPYPSVAKEIQKAPQLHEKLTALQQLMLLCQSPMLCNKLADPAINQDLTGSDFVALSQYSLPAMRMILSTPELYLKLNANNLMEMGSKNQEMFLMIQQNPLLWDRLDTEHLLDFHHQYPGLHETLMKNDKVNEINRVELKCEHQLREGVHQIAKALYVPNENKVCARTRPVPRRR